MAVLTPQVPVVPLSNPHMTLTDLDEYREAGGQPLSLQPPSDWELGAEQQVEGSDR